MKRKYIFAYLVMLFTLSSVTAQKWGNTPEDSVECVQNLSLYQEFYKQQSYKDAYKPWKAALNYCPCSGKNIYIRGLVIVRHMIQNEKDSIIREQYEEELIALYDKRTECYPEEAFENMAKKAIDIRTYKKEAASESYYKLLEEAIKSKGESLDPLYAYYFFIATIEYVHANKANPILIIENYDIVYSILEKAAQSNPSNVKELEAYMVNVETSFAPYANCDQLVEIFNEKFKENEDDVAFLKKVTSLLDSKKCTDNNLFFKATEKLHQKEPTPRSAYLMGKLSMDNKQYSKAIQYLREAADKLELPSDLYSTYIALTMCHYNLNQYPEARNAANQAANQDKTKGEPYLLIAQMYLQSAGTCCGDGIYKRVAFWAVVDKAQKAKSVSSDPNVIDQANKLINTYSAYFPEQGEAFMEGLEDGAGFTVGGWIQEHTIVRTKK